MTRRQFPKPLLAAVNGLAFGGGCEIALACDVVVAAEHATFGLPEVKRGIIAAAGGLIRLPKIIPPKVALELAMTGDTLDAFRAYELGLVNRVVAAHLLLEETIAIADRICANAPVAVRVSKRVMWGALDVAETEAWELSASGVSEIMATEDSREGPRAFVEKRPPVWQGR
jgi:enoyl-CoA hydratase/carnithine racemase